MSRSRLPVLISLSGSLLGALGVACSDYTVDKVERIEPGGGVPELSVSPESLELGATCGIESHTVTLSNTGDAPLTVSELIVSGDGWSLDAPPELPLVLDPSAQADLLVTGSGGPASLAVRSDDPSRSQVTVVMSSAPDALPELVLDAPPDSGALGPGALLSLSGVAADGAVDPSTLQVHWTSDVDGDLGTTGVQADGSFGLTWDGLVRTPGAHLLTATLEDACGNTVQDTILVCQEAGYAADDLDLASWNFEGTAFYDVGRGAVELTDLDPFAVGTAFLTASTVPADAVTIRFEFSTGGGTGADGFSVTALDTARMTGFMGAPGCALGYGEAHDSCIDEGEALPGWSIEVDTYYNPYIDPSSNDHLSLTFDGDLDTTAAWTDLPEVEDTGWHTLEIAVRGAAVRVSLDDDTLVETEAAFLPFDAYIGFTAATGADTNQHTIRSLTVEGDVCDGWVPLD